MGARKRRSSPYVGHQPPQLRHVARREFAEGGDAEQEQGPLDLGAQDRDRTIDALPARRP